MAGVKGRSGGARPGSGRKRKETVVVQAKKREIVLDVFSDPVWRATVIDWMQTARRTGNYALLFPLLPYILGGAKSELVISGTVEHVEMQHARTVLRVVGGGEERTA